ncbi:MAG: MoxR family ATPase [Rhodopirellula sp.]|nr:MoxR family ATPase [Rhodopirellula sp.]
MKIDVGQKVTLSADHGRPEQVHVFDRRSVQAVRAAWAARRPLLIRGEPGVGKTQLAAAVAKASGRVLVSYVVDSRTESRDLLWEFDAVMRLAEAQLAGNSGGKVDRSTLAIEKFVRPGPVWWAFNWKSAEEQADASNSPVPVVEQGTSSDSGCVLLIDEIDKAESDVPNGLLEALGAGQFTPFGRQTPVIADGEPPVVIITTNEERALPDAFLRRCLVLKLRLPKSEPKLKKLLIERGKAHFRDRDDLPDASDELLDKAAQLLVKDRQDAIAASLRPFPGQAEFLDLVRAALELESDETRRLELLDSVAGFAFRKQFSNLDDDEAEDGLEEANDSSSASDE